jgi:hypothetical protein
MTFPAQSLDRWGITVCCFLLRLNQKPITTMFMVAEYVPDAT